MNLDILYVFVYSYLLGSIPFGLIITKIFLGKDIRKVGSGNIGTTNVLRTGKKSLAAATLLFDVLKGYFSIIITYNYFNDLINYADLNQRAFRWRYRSVEGLDHNIEEMTKNAAPFLLFGLDY